MGCYASFCKKKTTCFLLNHNIDPGGQKVDPLQVGHTPSLSNLAFSITSMPVSDVKSDRTQHN